MLVATKLQLSAETARGGRTFLGKRFPQGRERCSLRAEGQRVRPPAAPAAGRYACRETGGRYCEMSRTTADTKTQCAAPAIAAHCDRRCSALRWVMHRTASHKPAAQGTAGGTLCVTGERVREEAVRARRGGAQGRAPDMLPQEAQPPGQARHQKENPREGAPRGLPGEGEWGKGTKPRLRRCLPMGARASPRQTSGEGNAGSRAQSDGDPSGAERGGAGRPSRSQGQACRVRHPG